MPRLHEVDSYSLSGWAEGKLTDSKHDGNLQEHHETETGTVADVVKISKRNTEDSLTAARQRFLERKRAREKNQGR